MKQSSVLLAACTAALLSLPAAAVTVTYSDFADLSGFQRNGSAASIANPATDGLNRQVLRLSDDLFQSGSAFLTNTINLANNASFSTAFSFRISNPQGISEIDGPGADGIVFVVQTVSNTAGGVGGGIGYEGIIKSVGVEFDTWNNGSGTFNDPDGNHVGINLDGGFNGPTTPIGTRMNNAADWFAWVDYDGVNGIMEARLSETFVRPSASTLTLTGLDLVSVLGQTDAYIGFTSGTGSAGGDHDIVNWTFRDDFAPLNVTPEPGSLALLGAAAIALVAARRRRV